MLNQCWTSCSSEYCLQWMLSPIEWVSVVCWLWTVLVSDFEPNSYTFASLSLLQVFFQWVSVTSVSFAAKMMDLKESSLSATFSAGSCAAVANVEPNQRQNVSNSNANQLNTSTATPVISLFKLKNFLYQPKFKSLMTSDGKASPFPKYEITFNQISNKSHFNWQIIWFN